MKKMSLANIEGKLSRTEMRSIMAGSSGGSGSCCITWQSNHQCWCGYSQSQAMSIAAGSPNIGWCCDSCGRYCA